MSLSVYLTLEDSETWDNLSIGISVIENGAIREISKAEWYEKFPNATPVDPITPERDEYNREVYSCDITHNLTRMAKEAGVYDCVWHPEDNGITQAKQLIEPLQAGLAALEGDPDHFRQFNPANGWGDYEYLASFIRSYLKACERYSQAKVSSCN